VMDGVTAARSIRADLAHCNSTPILALSAFLADSTEHTNWRDAFDSAVPKPANSNELMAAMAKALGQNHDTPEIELSEPGQDDVAKALRGALSIGSWKRLSATAAEEMRQLTLTMAAGFQAVDGELINHCAHALKGLALNFGANRIARLASSLRETHNVEMLTPLLAEISAWEKAN
jgi:DNA-binding response OmpR family regulator